MFHNYRCKMAAEIESQHCLAPRLYSYPVVKAAYDQLAAGYVYSKDYRGIGSLIGLAEASLRMAVTTVEPVLHKVDRPILSAEKLACSYLDTVDQKYPSVKSTPLEILESAQTYYNDSRLKPTVDYSIEKATTMYGLPRAGIHYCQTKKEVAVEAARSKLESAVTTMTAQMHSVLDVAEGALDKISAAGTSEEKVEGANGTVAERITGLYSRATADALQMANSKADHVRQITSTAMERLYGAAILLDYAKARQEWARETLASFSNETWQLIDSAKGRIYAFSSKLSSVDDVSKEASKLVHAQLERLNATLHMVIDFLNENVIPASPDNGHHAAAPDATGLAVNVEEVSPRSSTSMDGDDESFGEESFD